MLHPWSLTGVMCVVFTHMCACVFFWPSSLLVSEWGI